MLLVGSRGYEMSKLAVWEQLRSFLAFLGQFLCTHRGALLLLLLGVWLPLRVFGELAAEVWEQEGFAWDEPILLAIHATATAPLTVFATLLTQLGVFWGVFPVAGGVAVVLFRRRHWRALSYWAVTLLGSVVLNLAAKALLRRVRPNLWVSPAPELDYGFPSGHAMSSMTLVAALVVLGWQTAWRWPVLVVGSLFVLAIGWTRLYLGVHYPSDILAGWLASVVWVIGVSLLIKPSLKRGKP